MQQKLVKLAHNAKIDLWQKNFTQRKMRLGKIVRN